MVKCFFWRIFTHMSLILPLAPPTRGAASDARVLMKALVYTCTQPPTRSRLMLRLEDLRLPQEFRRKKKKLNIGGGGKSITGVLLYFDPSRLRYHLYVTSQGRGRGIIDTHPRSVRSDACCDRECTAFIFSEVPQFGSVRPLQGKN